MKEERGLSVQIGIEVFAGDRLLTRWQAPNLKADILIDRLAAIGDFAPDFENSTNLNGAIIQGLDRLAADTDSFRRRNRGGAFTTEYLVVFTDGADTAGFERTDAVLERIAVSSAEVTVVGLDSPDFDADALQALATDGLLIAPMLQVYVENLKPSPHAFLAKCNALTCWPIARPSKPASIPSPFA